jgi:hypothetical protein
MSLAIFGVNFVGFDAQSLFEWREGLIGHTWLVLFGRKNGG